MKTFFWLGMAIIALIAAPRLYQAYQHDTAANAKRVPIDAARMRERINAISPGFGWRATNIDRLDSKNVSITLIYRSNIGQIQAEFDTTTAVRTIIQELVSEGITPSKYGSIVFAFAQQDGLKGETGVPLVISFGSAHYDYNDDQIVYKPSR